MRFLMIQSHPYKKSFNAAIEQVATDAITSSGHDVEIIDLIHDGFNPVMTELDLRAHVYKESAEKDPLIAKYQKALVDSDIILFVFPIWWGLMPAVLKGFLDKVFTAGFAFRYQNGKLEGLLKKKAVVITTMSAPYESYKELYQNPIYQAFIKNTLGYVGIETLRHIMIDRVQSITHEQRVLQLNDIHEYIKSIGDQNGS